MTDAGRSSSWTKSSQIEALIFVHVQQFDLHTGAWG